MADESWPRDARDPLPRHRRRHPDRRAARTAPRPRARRRATFCLAYADGVADIDLGALLAYPLASTAAPRRWPWFSPGSRSAWPASTATGRCVGFTEKPRSELLGERRASSASSLPRSTCSSPDSVLEREPLERLAAAGQLRAFRHQGFWDCMDTYKDAITLNDLWADGQRAVELWEL